MFVLHDQEEFDIFLGNFRYLQEHIFSFRVFLAFLFSPKPANMPGVEKIVIWPKIVTSSLKALLS